MPGPDSQVLERLRGVFFDELEDQLAVMETQLAVFVEAEQDPGVRSTALNELYRATHSLKGAAGAVGWEEPERICHRLEETLASARKPGWELDVRAIVEPTLLTISQLKTWATQQRPADVKVTEESDSLPSQRGSNRDLRS
jgi:two-component system chemotaxis sensor kinase CheA